MALRHVKAKGILMLVDEKSPLQTQKNVKFNKNVLVSNSSRLDRTLPGLPNPFSRDVSTTQNTIRKVFI